MGTITEVTGVSRLFWADSFEELEEALIEELIYALEKRPEEINVYIRCENTRDTWNVLEYLKRRICLRCQFKDKDYFSLADVYVSAQEFPVYLKILFSESIFGKAHVSFSEVSEVEDTIDRFITFEEFEEIVVEYGKICATFNSTDF